MLEFNCLYLYQENFNLRRYKMKKKLVPVEKFMEVALANGYEVFDEAQVAAYAKDFMTKSQAGEVLQEDKDEFAVEMAGLQKAICAGEDGNQCTIYYRRPLVDWKVDSNGLVMKGIAGTYTDTPENRKLNRVGQAYAANPDVIKAIYGDIEKSVKEDEAAVDAELSKQADSIKKSCLVVTADADRRLALGEIDETLCKSVKDDIGLYLTSWGDTLDECCDVVKSEDLADVREDLADASAAFADIVKAAHGRYADTAKNRRLHRVGQEYGKAAQEKDKGGKKQGAPDDESGGKPSRNGDSVKRDISILEENKDKIVEKYGQEAYDKKIESLKKEGEDFEQKETVKQLKERADKQDAEEQERKKAEKRAKRQERRRARHAAKREAAKKAKEEAEAKAKAEAEKKEEQEPEKKKEQSEQEPKKDGIKLTPKGIKDYVAKNSATADDRMKAMAEAYKALKDSGKSKKVDTFVKEVSSGSPKIDMTTRKYLEASMAGATHEEAKEFAQKTFEALNHDIEVALAAAKDGHPTGMIDHLLKTAYDAFDKVKFTKNESQAAEKDTKKKVRAFIKNGLDSAVDKAMKGFVDDFYGGNGEHLNVSDYVNSGDFQEYLREELPDGIMISDLKEAVSSAVKGGIQRMKDAASKEADKLKAEEEKLKTSKVDEAKKAGASPEEAKAFVDKLYADTIARAEREYKRDLEDGKLPYGAEDYQKKYARAAFDDAKFEKDKEDYGYMDKGDVDYVMKDATVTHADIDELLSTIKEHGIAVTPNEMRQGAISTKYSGDAFGHEASVVIPGAYNRRGMEASLKGKKPEKIYSLNLKLKNGRTLRDFNMGRVTRDDIESAHLQVNYPKDNTYTIQREKINLDEVPIRAF